MGHINYTEIHSEGKESAHRMDGISRTRRNCAARQWRRWPRWVFPQVFPMCQWAMQGNIVEGLGLEPRYSVSREGVWVSTGGTPRAGGCAH
jgi:hypothetical protein